MAGVESTGFVKKTLAEIKAEVEAEQRQELGSDLNQGATSVLGILNGIDAAGRAELWEVGEDIYTSFDPDQASGDALDRLCALTGVKRLAAAPSTVTLTITGTAATVLAAGRLVRVPGNEEATFETLEEATIGGGGTVDVEAECTSTGPITANTDTLTEIVTPQSGWTSVTNAADADIGRDIETDAALRVRREESLRVTGSAALAAIRSDVFAVDSVTECTVFENTTDTTDGDGLPAHSFEVVVSGGDAGEIREAIFASAAAGIGSHGSTSGTVEDSQGVEHTVKFSRPDEQAVHVIVEVDTDAELFPADGETQIKTALAAWAQANLATGDDVVQTQLYAPVFAISGVLDVTKLWISFTDPPTEGSNLTIGTRELATIDTANVDVTAS